MDGLVGCYRGLIVRGGPKGVGNAVNETVVTHLSACSPTRYREETIRLVAEITLRLVRVCDDRRYRWGCDIPYVGVWWRNRCASFLVFG